MLRYGGADAEVRAALAAQPEPEIAFNYLGQFDGGAAADDGVRASPAARGDATRRRATAARSLLEVTGGIGAAPCS